MILNSLLSGILTVTFVHELAHVICVTFALTPTPEHIRGWGTNPKKEAYDEQGSIFTMGESGDAAENVPSGDRGKFYSNWNIGESLQVDNTGSSLQSESLVIQGGSADETYTIYGRNL